MKGCLKFLLIVAILGGIGIAIGIRKLATIPPPELSAIEKEIGGKPIVLENRPPAQVSRFIKQYLKDPDSLQFAQVAQPVAGERNGRKCWIIVLSYRAKNGFGGYTVENGIAYMERGSLIDFERLK